LNLLAKRRAGFRGNARVLLFGRWLSRDFRSSEIADLGISSMVEEIPPPVRPELLTKMRAANLFLCINAQDYNRAVPGKLYEYWAAGSAPVLVLDDGASAARTFAERNGLGVAVQRDDVETIARRIEEYYDAWLNGSPVTIRTDGRQRFDRRNLADEMGRLIDEVMVHHPVR
jgi:hypothetical protein